METWLKGGGSGNWGVDIGVGFNLEGNLGASFTTASSIDSSEERLESSSKATTSGRERRGPQNPTPPPRATRTPDRSNAPGTSAAPQTEDVTDGLALALQLTQTPSRLQNAKIVAPSTTTITLRILLCPAIGGLIAWAWGSNSKQKQSPSSPVFSMLIFLYQKSRNNSANWLNFLLSGLTNQQIQPPHPITPMDISQGVSQLEGIHSSTAENSLKR